jgi:hypothetical protein
MELEKILELPAGQRWLQQAHLEKQVTGQIDLSRAKQIKVNQETYLEAQSKGLTLSELLESGDYDPSPLGSPLDAFERQLAAHGIRVGGKNPTTVELFYQGAPALLPEFMLREVKNGMKMRSELDRLIASSSVVNSNRYTPFFIDTSATDSKLSLRPIGDGAEVPSVSVTEQLHSINVPDYGVTLRTSYKALRYRTTAQFKVILWFLGFRLQSDKIGLIIDTIINGDGNNNPASVVNTAVSGTLAYSDLITFWNEFYPFQMNTILAHKDKIKTILTMDEFKDPLAGFRFQASGELVSPLGSTLIRSDEVPTDLLIGLDNRFAVEEVIAQPLMIEYDKVIDQKFEEAVVSESVAYVKVISGAGLILDVSW